jgi:hypothetical protein
VAKQKGHRHIWIYLAIAAAGALVYYLWKNGTFAQMLPATIAPDLPTSPTVTAAAEPGSQTTANSPSIPAKTTRTARAVVPTPNGYLMTPPAGAAPTYHAGGVTRARSSKPPIQTVSYPKTAPVKVPKTVYGAPGYVPGNNPLLRGWHQVPTVHYGSGIAPIRTLIPGRGTTGYRTPGGMVVNLG